MDKTKEIKAHETAFKHCSTSLPEIRVGIQQLLVGMELRQGQQDLHVGCATDRRVGP
jgi:hypothetical protein